MDYWTKTKVFKNGSATLEKNHAFYVVKCYLGHDLHDKILCDSYQAARDYYKAFQAIAKNH